VHQQGDEQVRVTHCHPMRGAHLDGCSDERCKGCLPRLAEDRSLVCAACRLRTSDRAAALPQLSVDLLTPTKAGPGAKRAPGAERPEPLGSAAREAREGITWFLTNWTADLPRPALAGPDRTVSAMTTRLLAHLPRLLADETAAGRLVHVVDVVWAEAHRRAYPATPLGHVIGACPVGRPIDDHHPDGRCGGTVRAIVDTLDQQGWARCNTCKTSGVIDWWLAAMPPEQQEWLGMKALRWHLALHCGRQIAESTIRSWAEPPARGGDPALPSIVDEATGRPQYRAEEARELCEQYRRRQRPVVVTETLLEAAREQIAGGAAVPDVAAELGIGRSTLYRALDRAGA
jgi:hypothetical protein